MVRPCVCDLRTWLGAEYQLELTKPVSYLATGIDKTLARLVNDAGRLHGHEGCTVKCVHKQWVGFCTSIPNGVCHFHGRGVAQCSRMALWSSTARAQWHQSRIFFVLFLFLFFFFFHSLLIHSLHNSCCHSGPVTLTGMLSVTIFYI